MAKYIARPYLIEAEVNADGDYVITEKKDGNDKKRVMPKQEFERKYIHERNTGQSAGG